MTAAADFWKRLEQAEAERKAREGVIRSVRVRPQYQAASNDEPEPRTFRVIHEEAQAEARSVMRAPRTVLRARSLNQQEQE